MRNIIVRLDPLASLEYKRPESLEETPTKDIDTFLKESKSLLGTPGTAQITMKNIEPEEQ